MNLFYKKSPEYFINKINRLEHFKYSTFNRKTMEYIIGKAVNKDGSNDIGITNELRVIIKEYKYSDDYILSLNEVGLYNKKKLYCDVIDYFKEINSHLKFMDNDWLYAIKYNDPKLFISLIELLNKRNVIFVGGSRFRYVERDFPNMLHIELPDKNYHLSIDMVIEHIKMINNVFKDNIYLFNAGVITDIIIDKFKDDGKNSYIDMGNLWDSFFVSEEFNFVNKKNKKEQEFILTNYKQYLI
ncbi:MAG: hypothetical protein EOL88_02330 [Bacteroidia bacterium]|nr:hypothetical protein [Bacteroidia bacterium]